MSRKLPFIVSPEYKATGNTEPYEPCGNEGAKIVHAMRDRLSLGRYASLPKPIWMEAMDFLRGA